MSRPHRQQDEWAAHPPEPPPGSDPQIPANPFKDKRLRDRFGHRLDQVYPASEDAPPDEISHLLRKIAARMDG